MEEDEEREEDEGEELLECEGDLVVSFLLVSIVLLLADGNGSVFYRFFYGDYSRLYLVFFFLPLVLVANVQTCSGYVVLYKVMRQILQRATKTTTYGLTRYICIYIY